jgi:hypothetical protein
VEGVVSDLRYDGSPGAPVNPGTYAVTADFQPLDGVNYQALNDAPAGQFIIQPAHPGLALTVYAQPSIFKMRGEVIQFFYIMTNTGDVPLAAPFAVEDDRIAIVCPSTPALAPGASITCQGVTTTTAQDVSTGSITAAGIASARFADENLTSNTAQVSVPYRPDRLFLPVITH